MEASDNKGLRAQIAVLETKVDFLESEITHLDDILRECGFPEGLYTLKKTVEELIGEKKRLYSEDEEED